jgi:hypothetical protein
VFPHPWMLPNMRELAFGHANQLAAGPAGIRWHSRSTSPLLTVERCGFLDIGSLLRAGVLAGQAGRLVRARRDRPVLCCAGSVAVDHVVPCVVLSSALTNSELPTAEANLTHRRNAIFETTFADVVHGRRAHPPTLIATGVKGLQRSDSLHSVPAPIVKVRCQ